MKPGMKMYMLSNQKNGQREMQLPSGEGELMRRDDYRSDFEKRNGPGGENDKNMPQNRYAQPRYNQNSGDRNDAQGNEMRYQNPQTNEARYRYDTYNESPESRFRDSRGRKRYNDGRYAPQNYALEDNYNMEGGRENMENPTNAGRAEMMSTYRYGGGEPTSENRMNMIGFALDNEYESGPHEFRQGYRATADRPYMHEMEYRKAPPAEQGHASSAEHKQFGKEEAEKWTKNMKNQDGTTGARWRFAEILHAMAQQQIECDPYEFYAVVNAMYSDYSKVLGKYGISDDVAVYAELAKAFIEDKDAVENKVSMYYNCIVKH